MAGKLPNENVPVDEFRRRAAPLFTLVNKEFPRGSPERITWDEYWAEVEADGSVSPEEADKLLDTLRAGRQSRALKAKGFIPSFLTR
jgi:hypothetical protein